MDSPKDFPYYTSIHEAAVQRGEESYLDPHSGLLVYTSLFHQRRGYCCKNGCRHCPWGNGPMGSQNLSCHSDIKNKCLGDNSEEI